MPFKPGQSANPATQFKPGQSGNPAGMKKGTKHLSKWIQEAMEDLDFEILLQHPTKGYVPFRGAPVQAIVVTAVRRAAAGDDKAREWLAKYGYGQKLDLTTNGKELPTPILALPKDVLPDPSNEQTP